MCCGSKVFSAVLGERARCIHQLHKIIGTSQWFPPGRPGLQHLQPMPQGAHSSSFSNSYIFFFDHLRSWHSAISYLEERRLQLLKIIA